MRDAQKKQKKDSLRRENPRGLLLYGRRDRKNVSIRLFYLPMIRRAMSTDSLASLE